jgi:hypothetical protein
VPASASGQPLPNCGYLPAHLQPLQTASQLIPLSPLLPVCIVRSTLRFEVMGGRPWWVVAPRRSSGFLRYTTVVPWPPSAGSTVTTAPDCFVTPMWPFGLPSTLYFRTQSEAYSYGDRLPSGWNPVVGAAA